MVDRILISANLPFPSLIDWDEIALFTHSLGAVQDKDGSLRRLAAALEAVVGKVCTQLNLYLGRLLTRIYPRGTFFL
jgi:hypothetical protein